MLPRLNTLRHIVLAATFKLGSMRRERGIGCQAQNGRRVGASIAAVLAADRGRGSGAKSGSNGGILYNSRKPLRLISQ